MYRWEQLTRCSRSSSSITGSDTAKLEGVRSSGSSIMNSLREIHSIEAVHGRRSSTQKMGFFRAAMRDITAAFTAPRMAVPISLFLSVTRSLELPARVASAKCNRCNYEPHNRPIQVPQRLA